MYCPTGVNIASEILGRSEKFLVYYDPDVDGLFSGDFCCDFLDAFGKSYEVYINENRGHGFFLDWHNLAGYTILAVDFSITQEVIDGLASVGAKLINIDHHDISSDKLITYKDANDQYAGVVINNQYCFEPEEYRFLSGAGMVYYVLSSLWSGFDTEDHRAFVGITLLSDIRAIENDIAKAFLCETYNCRTPRMLHLMKISAAEVDWGFGKPMMDRNYIDYTFNPKFNALFRLNQGYLAMSLIRGAFPPCNLEEYRTRQNVLLDEILAELSGIEYEHLIVKCVPDRTFLEFKLSNFIGLACSRIKSCGKTTFLYVQNADGTIRGSLRGMSDIVDYLSLARKCNLSCAGHKNAFGAWGTPLSAEDAQMLSNEIGMLEAEASVIEYDNRIVEVGNLGLALRGKLLKDIALTNIFVRDSRRVYIKYTGTSVRRTKQGKMWQYIIDGVRVKCFDDYVSTVNGYILPILERGYITFYLKNIKK